MQLNHNSFSAKLYRWFYGVDSMPGNLCPYFWKLVIAYVMALPLFVSTLPYEIIYFKSRENDEKISNRIFVSFIICLLFLAAFCLFSVFSLIFGYRPVHESGMYYSIGTGIWGWLIIIPVVSYHGIKYLIQKAKELGAERIEFYTGYYAESFNDNKEDAISKYKGAYNFAVSKGLEINAGHDLNLENLSFLKEKMPELMEVSIGHALISDCLYFGLENVIPMYKKQLNN
jgi:hypothetical protein